MMMNAWSDRGTPKAYSANWLATTEERKAKMKRVMKENMNIIVLVTALFLLAPVSAQGGTYYTGVKYWHATWDSAILDWFEKDIAETYRENRLILVSHKDPGDGYLAGPLFGYQTDDRKWSFSFSPMVFSSFSQEWEGSNGFINLANSIVLERKDFDFAASSTINKYLKWYVGYKYQDMKMDFNLTYVVPGTNFSHVFHYEVESKVHIPTVGLAGVYQITDHFVVGLQAGVLFSVLSTKSVRSVAHRDQYGKRCGRVENCTTCHGHIPFSQDPRW